jgi:2-polyprenyl-6-methoxyphenol hydroxylase-like FAD-dependent oxidoreductase
MPGMNGKIIVGGAGIGGLSLALALLRRGVDVVVCEQADQLAEVGAGIQITPNGTQALADLGVLDELAKVSSEPDAKRIRLWNTGQTTQPPFRWRMPQPADSGTGEPPGASICGLVLGGSRQ